MTLFYNYGLTTASYEAMLDGQGRACAICQTADAKVHRKSGTPYKLAVDHDHKSGAIRGLLCDGCNWGLGHFRDSPEVLEKAAIYLREAKAKEDTAPKVRKKTLA